VSQQESIDQLQVVQDQLQTVRRLLAAQQSDGKRLSEQVATLTRRDRRAAAVLRERPICRGIQSTSARNTSIRSRPSPIKGRVLARIASRLNRRADVSSVVANLYASA